MQNVMQMSEKWMIKVHRHFFCLQSIYFRHKYRIQAFNVIDGTNNLPYLQVPKTKITTKDAPKSWISWKNA